MKNVFRDNSEVAHVFAQRTQSNGRSGNIFFEKNTIYSYGYHFPIATFHERKGKTVLLFNASRYSATTSQHQFIVSSACSQYKIIECQEPTGDHQKNIKYFNEKLEETKKKALSARKNTQYFVDIHIGMVNTGNEYIKFFGLKEKKFKSLLKNGKELEKQIASQKIAVLAQRKKEQQKLNENISLWLKKEFNGNLPTENQYLRMKDSETVESSKGAQFPLSHAILALKKVRDCKKNAIDWHRNGQEIRVGMFHIDSIDAKGNIVAGCHRIKYSEIERFAVANNL